jgi:hypothetical protein
LGEAARKENIRGEIKVLDDEILCLGKELEERIDYVKKKMTRKLKRRGLRL